MKKYLFLLFALCAFGAFTACSDDDDNPSAEEISAAVDPYGKYTEEGMAAYSALTLLCDLDSLPNNWRTATYAPTYGYAVDEANPYVRTVYVEDISQAEDCFRSLGGEIESGAASATYTAGNISYKYTAKNESDLFATIDCSVPQIPTLSQLRFVPNDVQEENGLFGYSWKEGDEAYYSLGDVVEDPDDKTLWVCVRAAYPNKKDNSYWVAPYCLDGTRNDKLMQYKEYKESGDYKYYNVPTKLGSDADKIKNFVMLVDIIRDPSYYAKSREQYGFGLGEGVYNKKYFENLQKDWQEKSLTGYYDDDDLKPVEAKLSICQILGLQYFCGVEACDDSSKINKELSAFYKGYSSFGWSMTLWTMCKGDEVLEDNYNMDFIYSKPNWSMKLGPFDIDKYCVNNPLNRNDNTSNQYGWGGYSADINYDVATSTSSYKDNYGGLKKSVSGLPSAGVMVWNMSYSGNPTEAMKKKNKEYIDVYRQNAKK